MDIDKTIQELFKKLEERKARVSALKAVIQKSWVTNGTWKVPFTSTVINLQTLPADQLYQVAGHIMDQFEQFSYAQTLLDNEADRSPKMQGYTRDAWVSDIRKRKATIEIREEETKLAELETRLNSVLSPEERRRIEVELLAKSLL